MTQEAAQTQKKVKRVVRASVFALAIALTASACGIEVSTEEIPTPTTEVTDSSENSTTGE